MMSLMRRRMMMATLEGDEEEMKWEKLIDFTAEELMQSITFTKDDNGQEFSLSAVSVFVDMAPPEDEATTTAMEIGVACDGDIYRNRASIGRTPVYGGVHKYGHAIFERMDYGIYPIIQETSANDSTVADKLKPTTNAYGYYAVDTDGEREISGEPDCCNAVSVGSHYQKVITKGTRIIIKGVKA